LVTLPVDIHSTFHNIHVDNTTGYIGVVPVRKRFCARIGRDITAKSLGGYGIKEAAACAVNRVYFLRDDFRWFGVLIPNRSVGYWPPGTDKFILDNWNKVVHEKLLMDSVRLEC
jgi:hypothetical protein